MAASTLLKISISIDLSMFKSVKKQSWTMTSTIFSYSPARVNGDIGFNVGGDFGGVHVRGVLEVSSKTMVLTDEGIKDISEVNVGILITSIDTAMLVVEFNGTSDGLGQGETRGCGNMVSQFCPFFGGDVLGSQGVSRFDFGEWSHGSTEKKNQRKKNLDFFLKR